MKTLTGSILLLLLTACSGAAPATTQDNGPGTNVGTAPASAPSTAPALEADVSNLGQDCAFGTSPGDLAGTQDGSCGEGWCLADARSGIKAYCTAECSREKACPAGYTCEAETLQGGKYSVCTQDAAVCGDGVIQHGEVCDDGNVDGDDACAADCSKVNTPFMVANFDEFIVGSDSIVLGEQKIFEAHRSNSCGTGTALLAPSLSNASNEEINFRLVVCDESRKFEILLVGTKRTKDPITKWQSLNIAGVKELPGNTFHLNVLAPSPDQAQVVVSAGTPAAKGYRDVSANVQLGAAPTEGPLYSTFSLEVSELRRAK